MDFFLFVHTIKLIYLVAYMAFQNKMAIEKIDIGYQSYGFQQGVRLCSLFQYIKHNSFFL